MVIRAGRKPGGGAEAWQKPRPTFCFTQDWERSVLNGHYKILLAGNSSQ
jgi:hypothetical protein